MTPMPKAFKMSFIISIIFLLIAFSGMFLLGASVDADSYVGVTVAVMGMGFFGIVGLRMLIATFQDLKRYKKAMEEKEKNKNPAQK